MTILKQEYFVTNPFNEQLTIEALRAQLSNLIFKELINDEKEAIKITFLIEVIEPENERTA